MLLIFLTIFFSSLSVGMMSYLAMNIQLGPWVAPVFVVVCMVLALPLVSRNWFAKHAMITIAAGSIGGMIGLCLGLTVPSFYFLNESEFLAWFAHPWQFASFISAFVACAGSFAFLIAFYIKDYLIVEKKLPFPMSHLIYNLVAIDRNQQNPWLMLTGIGLVSVWNVISIIFKTYVRAYVSQMNLIPMMISVGFVAGRFIAIPVLLGLITRIGALEFLQFFYFAGMSHQEFLVMFCVGMLLALIFSAIWEALQTKNLASFQRSVKLKLGLHNRSFMMIVGIIILLSAVLLSMTGVTMLAQLYIFPALVLVGLNVARIVGKIGVIEFDSFVWFIILPLIYSKLSVSSIGIICVALFATICFGMIVDLLFSYKLAELANISYKTILKYQVLGFLVAVICSGIIMWWYVHDFGLGSLQLVAPKAQSLDDFIQYGSYDYRILLAGFVWGCVMKYLSDEVVVVVGSILIEPTISVWLILAGAISYLIRHREKWYPLWFGVYAAHSLWIMICTILL